VRGEGVGVAVTQFPVGARRGVVVRARAAVPEAGGRARPRAPERSVGVQALREHAARVATIQRNEQLEVEQIDRALDRIRFGRNLDAIGPVRIQPGRRIGIAKVMEPGPAGIGRFPTLIRLRLAAVGGRDATPRAESDLPGARKLSLSSAARHQAA